MCIGNKTIIGIEGLKLITSVTHKLSTVQSVKRGKTPEVCTTCPFVTIQLFAIANRTVTSQALKYYHLLKIYLFLI